MTKVVSHQELEDQLAEHESWCAANPGADTRRYDGDFSNEDLSGRRLCRIDFSGTELRGANLHGADLTGVLFYDADLTNADLTNAIGLNVRNFGGAILTGAKLPEEIRGFSGLSQVSEISKNAMNVFLLIMGACLYCWLTIGTTTDITLIVNSSVIALPIIGTAVPAAGFYYAAPCILIIVYLYFLLYLQRLWQELAALPATFPDGCALDEKAYPWLLNGLVRVELPRLQVQARPLARLEAWIALLATWSLVPVTLAGLWLRYLPTHEWGWSAFHAAMLTIAVAAGLSGRRLAIHTLTARGSGFGFKVPPSVRPKASDYLIAIGRSPHVQYVLLVATAVFGLTGWTALSPEYNPLAAIGFRTTANLVEAELSTKLAGWKPGDITNVKGIDLRERDLRGAEARGAFLTRARLDRSWLDGADFGEADMQGASLADASIRGTIFEYTQFGNNADFYGVRGERADFQGVSLPNANFHTSRLCGANFGDAHLAGADLGDANLASASFIDANMTNVNFAGSSLVSAKLGGDSNLTGVNFKDADLCGAEDAPPGTSACRADQANQGPTRLRGWPHVCVDPAPTIYVK